MSDLCGGCGMMKCECVPVPEPLDLNLYAGHKPGPWSVEGQSICCEHHGEFAVVDHGNYENDVDARLIAAAPRLLSVLRAHRAALEQLWPLCLPIPGDSIHNAEVQDALARARAALALAVDGGGE